MILGNVIYKDELVNHEKVEYINYIQKPINFRELNTDIPTLYVGWFNMKELNQNDLLIQNQPILDKKIISNVLYWDFSFKENKGQHVEGVNYFVHNVPYYYFRPRYNYVNIDPVFFGINDLDDLNNILAKQYSAIYNYKGEMVYLLKTGKADEPNWNNNTRLYGDAAIVGIDLNMYEHFEFNIDALLQLLYKKVPTEHIYNDFDGEIYEKHYKTFPDFDDLKRYLIVLLSKG